MNVVLLWSVIVILVAIMVWTKKIEDLLFGWILKTTNLWSWHKEFFQQRFIILCKNSVPDASTILMWVKQLEETIVARLKQEIMNGKDT